jgi:ankyrin repeat protein
VRAAALALTLVVLLSACGGADEPEPSPELNAKLLEAARANQVDAARELIEQGADVNVKDETEQSAYLYATSEVGPDPALLELTLANGGDVGAKDSYNGTGLIRAAHRGYPEIVRRLIDAGVELDHVNRLGWTALLEAIILGDGGPDHVETVRLIVDAGADVHLADSQGVTPLAHAERAGQEGVAAILVAAGAAR